jgi:hypothetical protein
LCRFVPVGAGRFPSAFPSARSQMPRACSTFTEATRNDTSIEQSLTVEASLERAGAIGRRQQWSKLDLDR